MKKMRLLVNSVLLFLACLVSFCSYAQSGDDLNSVYDNKNYIHVASPYSGLIPYLVFGTVILFLGFLGYRYWHDQAPE